MKYILYKKYGEFPKTRILKMLLELTKDENLIKYYRENLDLFRDIELSYIATRYFDVECSENVVKKSLKLAEDFVRWLK